MNSNDERTGKMRDHNGEKTVTVRDVNDKNHAKTVRDRIQIMIQAST